MAHNTSSQSLGVTGTELTIAIEELVNQHHDTTQKIKELHQQKRQLMLEGDPHKELREIIADIRELESAFDAIEQRLLGNLGEKHLKGCIPFGRPGTVFYIQLGKKKLLVQLIEGETSARKGEVRCVSIHTPLGQCLCGASKEDGDIKFRTPHGAVSCCRILEQFSCCEDIPKALLAS